MSSFLQVDRSDGAKIGNMQLKLTPPSWTSYVQMTNTLQDAGKGQSFRKGVVLGIRLQIQDQGRDRAIKPLG